jgi:chromosome segregation ATPase
MTVETLQPLFASTSPIAIEEARAATIPSERASIAQHIEETRAARSALEAAAVADEKSHLAGAHEVPSDNPARDREISRLDRRERALAELLTESDDKLAAVHARITALTQPRNAAVDQLVGDMNEAALSELRSHMDAIHGSLVRLFASGHVA